MNNIFSIIIGLALVVGVGGLVFMQTSDDDTLPLPENVPTANLTGQPMTSQIDDDINDDVGDDNPTVEPGEGETTTAPAPTSSGISAATVAGHNTRESCWSSINGSVYDLTSWIPKHPGGEKAILGLCGADGSSKFNNKHGGSAKHEAVLVGFKIGALAQ